MARLQTFTVAALAAATLAAVPAQKTPPDSEFDATRLARIDELVTEAIERRELPGAVVLVGRGDRVAYRKAFGRRAVAPAPEPMTPETVFDLASLTKVVATTTAVMMLVEEGRVRLNDPVASFIPDFGRYGKNGVTVRHLLTHVSGLRPDLDLSAEFMSYQEAIDRASEEILVAPPGERFIYSDINFFLLGDIVARVSRVGLDEVARRRVFEPLGMRDTMFRPPAALAPRIAPTEPCSPLGWPCNTPDARMLRGVVHDPTARRMGGVAGHAGLFGTADNLARFCRMLIGGGRLGGVRILSPLTVAKMTTPATPAELKAVRGLGWDLDSSFSSNRGELLPVGSFGHTGFTGTGLWIDPTTGVFVVFLSNRVHPDGKGDVTALRGRVATVAAWALRGAVDRWGPGGGGPPSLRDLRWTGADFTIGLRPQAPGVPASGAPAAGSRPPVQTGIDILRGEGFARLRGKRVALVTNPVGRARDGQSTIDLLHKAEGVRLVALFSPEHGIRGLADEKVASSRDERTGLPIHSLYGETLRPTAGMLEGIDVIVVDLQDIGTRFYTYMSTLGYVMEEAALRQIAVVVLDRPNPINGVDIEGPVQDAAISGFTAYHPMPIRHGMTMGELARLFNAERKIGADLSVVTMTGWRRDDWFDDTLVPWVNPSPNMRNLLQATLYPGVGAIEGTNISVGRGTDSPFEQIGAPWIDGPRLAESLARRDIPGIRFYPIAFTPAPGAKFGGQACQGVFMVITDRAALRPVRLGVELASALSRLFGAQFEIERAERLFGSKENLARIRGGEDPTAIVTTWANGEARWRLTRAKYLLYR